MLVIGGCGGSSPPSVQSAATPERTATTTPAPPAAQSPPKSPSKADQARRRRYLKSLTKKFSGNGGQNLPPFTLKHGSTMRWANDGGLLFQVWDNTEGGNVFVNSRGSKGKTYMGPGRYKLQVNTGGNWTMTIAPNV